MRIVLVATVGIMALSLPGAALAGEGCGGSQSIVQHIFDVADEDGSGSLSAAEYGAAGLERFGVTFAESDANGDGETSLAEYLELYARYHSAADRISL